jgi:hypothetical protein
VARTQRTLELQDSPGSAALFAALVRASADDLIAAGEQSGQRLRAEAEAQFMRMHAAQIEQLHAPQDGAA